MKSNATFLLAALLALVACDGGQEAEPEGRAGQDPKAAPTVRATRVEAVTMKTSSLSIELERPGEVEGARDATIASAMGGQIEKVHVQLGDLVEAGQVIAHVDTSLQNAQVAKDRVEVKDAKRELARLESMGGTVATARLDTAKTRVDRAEASLRITRIRASRTVLKAPFAGTIAGLEMEKGEVAPPGAPLAVVVALDPAVVSVSVTDRDVSGLNPGLPVRVTAVGAAAPVEGKIARIDPVANIKTRTFIVEVEVANPSGQFRPGMIANVAFEGETQTDVMVIPQDFLVTTLDGNGVFMVGDDDTAVWRPLELGELVRNQIIISGGLSAGDRVVMLGQRGLSEGDPLIVTRLGTCCEGGRARFPRAGEDVVAASAKGDE